MDNMTLATELLHDVKTKARRWFSLFIAMVVIESLTITGFLWYLNRPIEDMSQGYTQKEDCCIETMDYNIKDVYDVTKLSRKRAIRRKPEESGGK